MGDAKKGTILHAITAPQNPAIVPELKLATTQPSPTTNTTVLHFTQAISDVPVFGAQAVVELNDQRELVSIQANVAGKPDCSAVAKKSPADAVAAVAGALGVTPGALGNLSAPVLHFYLHDGDGKWHLVYEIQHVKATAAVIEKVRKARGHGLAGSPRQDHLELTYIVDAENGEILAHYSSAPYLDFPTKCSGIDELKAAQTFSGFQNGAAFQLHDPIRKIRTLDLNFGDIAQPQLPNDPVQSNDFDFKDSNTAAISAHVNATRVFDFYNNVLKRNGVDDNGMELVSVVKVVYAHDENPPEWHNAVWYDNRMWYGQTKTDAGFDSFSRYLDVIAHELTHGVTATTSNLRYLGQSGALNESFSDIFGVIIANQSTAQNPADVTTWSWEIGAGLGQNGGPLRDLSDPTRTGDPAHMNDYQNLPLDEENDSGGVHTNSNIHNKAAYNVLTAKDADGKLVFTVEEASLLFYLTLTRLSEDAKFSDVLTTMKSVAKTYWAGRPADIQAKTAAIEKAYNDTGIT